MAKQIELGEDQYFPLNDAGQFIPGRPHRATVWRWALRGIKRGGRTVKLNTVAVGARRYTTHADIERFLMECNGSLELPPQPVSGSFQRRAEAAGKLLESMGLRSTATAK